MKKITLLLLFFASFSFSQTVVLLEDFEAGLTLPAGWTNNDIAAAGDTWTIDNTGIAALAGANDLVYSAGGCVGNYAVFDSDATSDNSLPEDVALESPSFSCASLTQVTLEYNYLFAGNFGGSLFVEVSSDDGANWTTITTYSADNYAGGLVNEDVSAQLAGSATCKVRFRWTGDWSVAAYIDNVRVFECADNAPLAAINPTPSDGNMMVQIVPDGADLLITPFAWEEDPNGDPAVSYTLSLGTTPTGDDIGTLDPATNGNGIIYTWAENTTYYWFVTGTNCGGTTQSAVWSFTTAACNETAAPACGNLLLPADNATDVATVEAGNGTREVNLSWEAVPGALAYNITFDGNDLGNTADTDIDIFGLDYDTQYTWSIAPVNCFGAQTGCATRTFTTEMDPGLSISEFDVNAISVYPNPVRDILNIKTELSLESVEVYNILGKEVKSVSGDLISDNSINLSELRSGIYFVNINADGKQQTIKVIKD